MSARNKEYLNLTTAAEELGMSRRTLERWIALGKLKCFKLGRNIRIERQYFEQWKNKNLVEA